MQLYLLKVHVIPFYKCKLFIHSSLAIITALVTVIVVGAYFVITNMNTKTPDNSAIGFILDENAKDYIGTDPASKSGDVQGIKIPGYDTVTLPSNTKSVKMILLNPEGNPCYFTFELVVKGETYYTSNLVEPSKCIEDLTLTKPLTKGEYKAVLQIRAYSLDENYTVMNLHRQFHNGSQHLLKQKDICFTKSSLNGINYLLLMLL